MKVDPCEHKSELPDDNGLERKDVKDYCQVYCPKLTSTNYKRKRDGDTWLEAPRSPGGRTRWPSRGTDTRTSEPGSVSSDLKISELHMKHWSKLCLYLDRGDD